MDKIKVAIRTRPFNKRELEINATEIVTINENQVVLNDSNKDGRNNIKAFTFDCCFDSSNEINENFADQTKVFNDLGLELLDNVLAGYNTCLFAYGQTGSGKSYTMMGNDGEDQKGLIPRLCESLFEKIASITNEDHLFKIEVSYMEIYNEKCRDLLDPSGSKQNLKLREHRLLGVYVDGLTQLAVSSYKDIEILMNKGNKSRTVAATNMNETSSRSHAVFSLQVSQNIIDKHSELSGEKLSRLSLVDLAGSEKVSKTGVEGFRLKEGCNINKSLSTLGLVISALAENSNHKTKSKHIPYRDSILTWLLKDSLGGNSKTVMISTISIASDSYDETLSTLRYADRAKRIVNNAVVNEDPNAKLIRNLRDELEMLKKELEKAKEQINAENLNDRLKESEKLYNEISKPWTTKLAESEKVQQELTHKLQSMGISVQSSGIKVEKDKYFLVNINADPAMNELLVYYLKDKTLVGKPNAEIKQDIQLTGPGVSLEHCIFEIKNNKFFITPMNNSKTRINGLSINKETLLKHGDRIEIGINHFFRLNCPSELELTLASGLVEDFYDLKSAQEEILFSKLRESTDLLDTSGEENSSANANMSTSSSSSSIGQPIYNLIQNSKLNNIQVTNGFRKLCDQLLVAHSLAREANSICKELDMNLRFSVTLHTPACNLTPNHKDTFLFEPALIVRSKTNSEQRIIIDTEKFETYMLHLRDIYFIFQNNPQLLTEDNERRTNIIDPIVDLILDFKSSNTLIGVANVYLDSLFVESCIQFEYDVPIISESGALNGKLKIKLERIETNEMNDDDDEIVNKIRTLKFKLNIVEAFGLPRAANNSIFCQYQFWIYTIPFIAKQKRDQIEINSTPFTTIRFDYENEFSIEMTEEFIEYCLDGCLSFEIFGQNILPRDDEINNPIESSLSLSLNKSYAKKLDTFNQMTKFENLIQSWSELSKSFEIYVHIMELNTNGNWTPVEVKQNDLIQTGGTYQLKQGQSRQISIRIKQTHPKSKMWYNGGLFNLVLHKIDKIEAGCVLGREIGINQPLDSYQEIDLNNLKEKCKNILEKRKQYLYEQLKELEQLETDENDKERYELLCKQLVEIGEQQASIDAPQDNSNLPGSVVDWQPAVHMEEHVPIIFLDLNKTFYNEKVNRYDEEEYDDEYDDYDQIRAKKTLNTILCGKESYLKLENIDTKFYDLKIVRWNNSENLEISADGDIQENDLFDDSDLVEKSLASPTIKAVALWDSSLHQSPYLNQITPFDKHVYLTLKFNLKFKLITNNSFYKEDNSYFKKIKNTKYIDICLRKRIAVNVYSPSSLVTNSKFTLNRIKTLIGSASKTGSSTNNKTSAKSIASSEHSTSVIYRIISDIPKCLTEIENHESFVMKAATSLLEESSNVNNNNNNNKNETSNLFFEQYLKTLKSVENILRHDRIQQQLVIKNVSKLFYKKNELAKSFNNNDSNNITLKHNESEHSFHVNEKKMKKTFSVPNLIKNSLGGIVNLNATYHAYVNDETNKKDYDSESKKCMYNDKQIIDSAVVNIAFKDLIITENTTYKNNENNQVLKSTKQYFNANSNDSIQKESATSNVCTIGLSPATTTNENEGLSEKSLNIIKSASSDLKNKLALDIISSNLDSAKSLCISNNSIASTLTNSSQLNPSLTSQDRLQQQVATASIAHHQSTEIIPDWIKENAHVIVATNSVMNKRGYVRYIGLAKFATGIWIGVELEEPHGKNDGALKGVRYFKCPENRGVFVKADKLTLINDIDN